MTTRLRKEPTNTFGNLIKTSVNAGGHGTTIACTFSNSGNVEIQDDSLEVNTSGNTLTGSYVVDANGDFYLPGDVTFDSFSSISGGGDVDFVGSPVTISGTYDVTGETYVAVGSAGTADFSGNVQSVGSTLDVASGIVSFGGTPITVDQLTLRNGSLTTGSIQAANFTWYSGTLQGSGAVNVSASLTLGIASYDVTLDGRTLNNLGTAVWTRPFDNSGGNIHLIDGAVLNNPSGSTFQVECDATTMDGDGEFNNAGTLIMNSTPLDAGGHGTTIACTFNNSGSVAIQSDELDLSIDNDSGGSYSVAAGADLYFASNVSLDGASSISGAGTIDGDVSSAGQVTPSIGSGCLTINGDFTQLTGGVLNINLAGNSAGTGYGQLVINGPVSLGGTLRASLNFPATEGERFTIIHDAGKATSGQFAGLPEGAELVLGDQVFSISYQGGSDSDVVLTDVGNSSYVVQSGAITENLAGSFALVKKHERHGYAFRKQYVHRRYGSYRRHTDYRCSFCTTDRQFAIRWGRCRFDVRICCGRCVNPVRCVGGSYTVCDFKLIGCVKCGRCCGCRRGGSGNAKPCRGGSGS